MAFKARIGKQRITSNTIPSQASYTRAVRKSFEEIEKEISRVCNVFADVTPEVIMDVLDPTFKKSLAYTPMLTGELRASGYLMTRIRGTKVEGEIGFGKGGDPYYAVYVHEMTDVAHKAPTRSKFLQAALSEDIGKFPSRLLKAYRAKVGFK